MKTYDTIIIFNDEITDAGYRSVISECKETLKELGCTLIKTDVLGKKKLAYPIKAYDGHEATEGWYVVFTYATNPENIAKLEKVLRTDEDVIKFLTMKRDPSDDEDFDEDDYKYESPIDPVETKSEQQPDALDVLLGFAKYKTKESD